MDLLQLQYFRTIAKVENLTKASELLFVAQPNLSVSISRLEEELGVALFDRRRGRIRLTPTGRLFLERVESILSSLDSAVMEVQSLEDVNRNHIRVAGSIVDLMGDILAQFYPENEDVSFKQVNCPNSDVPGLVLSEEVDFGIVYGLPQISGLEYIRLDDCERGLMVHASHRLADRDSVSIRELKNEKLICNRARDDDVFLRDIGGLIGAQPKIFFECDAMQVEKNLIATARGVELVPVTHYLKLLRTEPDMPIRYIRFKEKMPNVQLGMVRRPGGILTDAALRFYNHIARFFQHEQLATQEYLGTRQ